VPFASFGHNSLCSYGDSKYGLKLAIKYFGLNNHLCCIKSGKSFIYRLLGFNNQHWGLTTMPVNSFDVCVIEYTTVYIIVLCTCYLQISVNGAITLCGPSSDCTSPIRFTTEAFTSDEDRALVAPFWVDADMLNDDGEMYFHQNDGKTDPCVFDRINEMIAKAFPFQAPFSASNFIIATWHQVGYFDNHNDKVCI